eukprot:5265228-Pyramimonas_sp.AAC.1
MTARQSAPVERAEPLPAVKWQRRHNLRAMKELADALAGLRHTVVIDNRGVAVAAFWLLHGAWLDA